MLLGRYFLRRLAHTLGLLNPFRFFLQALFRFGQQTFGGALFGSQAFQPGEGIILLLMALTKLLGTSRGGRRCNRSGSLCGRRLDRWFTCFGTFYLLEPVRFFLRALFRLG